MNPSRILPIIIVAAVPLALGAWWLKNRTPQEQETTVQDVRPASEGASDDPWLYIQKPIYPRGRVETVHTNDQFTFLLVRVADADRWLATPPGDFSPGD
ncbi:MAG: hypothetical protein MI757_05155, partial [Pirellulales bacterium]|nr:hypothetical protein [Pirellulales bacterium]